jgi:hypothetical protein
MRSIPLFALALAACAIQMGEEALSLGVVTHDCVIPMPEVMGAPLSIETSRGSLWVFRNGRAAVVESRAGACADGLDFFADEHGEPLQILSQTEQELAENDGRDDGRQIELEPLAGFASGAGAVLYYDKILTGPGIFERERLGTGVCVLDSLDEPGACQRLLPQRFEGEASLIFDKGERSWNRSALVADDGQVYLYGCFHSAAFVDSCSVARVVPERIAEADAYQYYNVFTGWTDDPWNSTELFDSAGPFTISYSERLKHYVAVRHDIWEATFRISTSENPLEGFAGDLPLFSVPAPEDWFVDGGREHRALRDGDADLVLSYYTEAGHDSGLHLAGYKFSDDTMALELP